MKGVLPMSNQRTSKDLPSAISSVASEDGQELCRSQDGVQTDLFGQEVPLVSLSQAQEIKKAKTTSDTSGLSSSISSESADLQQSLESRLRQQLDLDGSTIYKLTWRQKVTPQRRSYCHLAASAPRTKEKDSSSWPTPSVRDYKDTGNLDKSRFRKSGKERNDTVPRVAYGIAPWATPNVSMTFPVNIGQQVASGTTPQSSTAETENTVPSQLNPRFSLWLMGYPIEWAYCAEQVTQSSRKRQQKS
jgi:hypothetical protein